MAESEVKAASPTKKLMKKPTAAAAEKVQESVQEAVETQSSGEVVDTADGVAVAVNSDDLIIKTVHELSTLKEDKAFKMVPQLLDNIDHDYFRLGGVLSVIQVEGWYMDKGYENFKAYVETDGGMQYRKAMYLISIYTSLAASGVEWEKVKHLGWTKLKDLAAVLTPENVDEWVAAVDGMTVLQIQDYIKAQTAGEASGDSADTQATVKETTTMTFKLHKDQKATVREALDKCKHESGTEFDVVALENICLDYLAGSNKGKAAKPAKVPTLKELMAGMSAEDVLGTFGEVFPDVDISVDIPE